VGLDEERRLKVKMDTPDELFARIPYAAARIVKPGDQVRRTASDPRFAKRAEVDGGNFQIFIVICEKIKSVISV